MSESATTIYTKLGDDGSTGRLFGGRLSKADVLVDACGDIDETVTALGVAREALGDDPELSGLVLHLQRHLFVVAADLIANPRARDQLAAGISRVGPEMADDLERTIDRLVAVQPLQPVFVVPGANRASAALDFARAVSRRAERQVVRARSTGCQVSPDVATYLNRLSDLLYVLARQTAGDDEEPLSHD